MPDPRLSSIDLNLLVTLDALLRVESVTAAGKQLGLSQPAVSQALAKLREWFADPLLVRHGGRMRRTALGDVLAARVRALLDEMEATLTDHRRFDPRASERRLRARRPTQAA